MFRLLIVISLIQLLGSRIAAQLKYDYTWPFGYDYDNTIEGAETNLLDFTSGKPTTRLVKGNLDLSSAIAAINDPQSGRLLFYTNGCYYGL